MTGIDHYASPGLKPEEVFLFDGRNAAFLAGLRETPVFSPPNTSIIARCFYLSSISIILFTLGWFSWICLRHEYLVYLIALPLFLGAIIIWTGLFVQILWLISNRSPAQNALSLMQLVPAIIVSGKPDDRFIIQSIVFFLQYRLKRSTFLYYAFYVPNTGQEAVFKERVWGTSGFSVYRRFKRR